MLDLSLVDTIALGVLSDITDKQLVGSNAASLMAAGGLLAALHPVVADPFTQLRLVATVGGAPQSPMAIDAALAAVNIKWKPWGRAAPPTFQSKIGLQALDQATAEALPAGDLAGSDALAAVRAVRIWHPSPCLAMQRAARIALRWGSLVVASRRWRALRSSMQALPSPFALKLRPPQVVRLVRPSTVRFFLRPTPFLR